jgi:hypothetical protein
MVLFMFGHMHLLLPPPMSTVFGEIPLRDNDTEGVASRINREVDEVFVARPP